MAKCGAINVIEEDIIMQCRFVVGNKRTLRVREIDLFTTIF